METSPESAEPFGWDADYSASVETARSVLTRKEFDQWDGFRNQIQDITPASATLLRAYFNASQVFFSPRSFDSMDGWISEALLIGAFSPDLACLFMEKTPEFVAHDNYLHLREWGRSIRETLAIQPEAVQAAAGLIESGVRLLQKVSYRIYQSWFATGIRLMRKSPAMGGSYFSGLPHGLDRLYQTEMRKIFELTAEISRELPCQAVAFFQSAPLLLLRLNPNVRERVLDVVKRNTSREPADIQGLFNDITRGIESLSYPDQEMVVKLERTVGAISKDAVPVYFQHAAELLTSVHDSFFPVWVAEGCDLLSQSRQQGLDHFAFKSNKSKAALSRWQHAVFLEDQEKQLTLYARALSGRAIRLRPLDDGGDRETPAVAPSPEEGGNSLYLPAHLAEGETVADNFRIYKVAVARQAGYFEFNTFGPKFERISSGFQAFPFPELIRDIFFILENGRIDRCLRANYRGLCSDLDLELKRQIANRPFPVDSPLHLALEILLRLVFDCHLPSPLPGGMPGYLEPIEKALADLYSPQTDIDKVFLKAVAIYDILKPLIPDQVYLPFQTFDYLDMPDLEMMAEGGGEELGDELKSGREGDGIGVDLTEEETARLMEMLKDITTLEPIQNGEGGKGFVLEGLTAQVAGQLDEWAEGEPRPEERMAVSEGLTRLTTRKGPFYYDEWDYLQKAYRRKWCCLREVQVEPATPDLYQQIYFKNSDLIRDVKRQFQRIRPEALEQMKRLEWGSEIDFNAMIQHVVDRKTGDTPSDRIFSRREKKRRSISTFLLIDMSASTDRKASTLLQEGQAEVHPADTEKRIIDIEIESLVVMAEALASLDDRYAIYGFSGYGREQVELFAVKDFSDPYSQTAKNRICGIQPRKSTRMGPAIRHAASRLRETDSDYQLLIMISDGYPQDLNYGEDRTSQTYALHDTMMAFVESKRSGIRPFCITIDQCGDDYLKQMMDPSSYLVIKNIYSLPAVLPRVVESLMG